ncbi:uncharacterized protein LOC135501467 [Lineus longissimus]|uniref:uncharacterized protein LOC135501467 n=1 Tax=Lineus longissimus TaxID=88925 RepID=UPI002B4DF785
MRMSRRIYDTNRDVPFRYLPRPTFDECARLLNPKTTKYSWQELAQKLKVPPEDISFIGSPGVTNADLPPAALTLQWFQYGGFRENGKLPKNYKEKGGTLAIIIEKLGEFPRTDVIQLLEDETILRVMHDEFNKDKDRDSDDNERKAPVEDSDPVDGFLRGTTANTDDNQGDSDNVNITIHSANITIDGTAQLIINVSNENDSVRGLANDNGETWEKWARRTQEQKVVASRFGGSDTSGSGTPSPGESPPSNGARPKDRRGGKSRRPSCGSPGQSGPINGNNHELRPCRHMLDASSPDASPPRNGDTKDGGELDLKKGSLRQDGQQRSNRHSKSFNRQVSNTSVSSCEMLLPESLPLNGPITDTDSEASSLNSVELLALTEQLQPHTVRTPPWGMKQCSCVSGMCKRKHGPMVGSNRPVQLQTQRSEYGTSGTRGRNNSEPNVLQNIDGPVLLLCDTTLMKQETSRAVLTTIGGAIRNRFKTTDGSDPVQFSLWGAARCRYSKDGNIRQEIALSLEKSALIVIFANRQYLKAIAAVENDNFVPKVDEEKTKCNVHYIYHLMRTNHQQQLSMNKMVIFCQGDQKKALPPWLMNSHIVAPWPVSIDDVTNVLLQVFPPQARLISRALSYSS